jgi:hypothetical protein
MANIPDFRDALFKSMARRLRETDAQIAEATDQQQRALADTPDTRDAAPCSRESEGSAPGERPTSHNLTPMSQRRWG